MALGKVKLDRLYLDSNTPSSTGTTPHLANAVLLRAASGQTQLQTLALPATSAYAGQTLVASFVETETVDGATRNVTQTSWSDGDSVDMTEARIAPLRLLTTATVEAASLAELSIGRSTMQNVTFAAGVTVAHVVRLSPASASGVEAQHYALSAGPPAEAPEDVAPLGVVLQSAAAGASGSVLTAGVTVVRTTNGAIPAGAALVVDTRTTGASAAGTVMTLADWRALGTTVKTFVVGRALLTKPAGEQLVVAAVERPTLCA